MVSYFSKICSHVCKPTGTAMATRKELSAESGVCAYFLCKSGCRKGNSCRFSHLPASSKGALPVLSQLAKMAKNKGKEVKLTTKKSWPKISSKAAGRPPAPKKRNNPHTKGEASPGGSLQGKKGILQLEDQPPEGGCELATATDASFASIDSESPTGNPYTGPSWDEVQMDNAAKIALRDELLARNGTLGEALDFSSTEEMLQSVIEREEDCQPRRNQFGYFDSQHPPADASQSSRAVQPSPSGRASQQSGNGESQENQRLQPANAIYETAHWQFCPHCGNPLSFY